VVLSVARGDDREDVDLAVRVDPVQYGVRLGDIVVLSGLPHGCQYIQMVTRIFNYVIDFHLFWDQSTRVINGTEV